jgi:hypothetical protein
MLVLVLSSQILKALEPFTPCGVDIGNRLRIRQRDRGELLGLDEVRVRAVRMTSVSKFAPALAEALNVTANPRNEPCCLPGDRRQFIESGSAFAFEHLKSDGFDIGGKISQLGSQPGQFGVKASTGTASSSDGCLSAGKICDQLRPATDLARGRRPNGARRSPFASSGYLDGVQLGKGRRGRALAVCGGIKPLPRGGELGNPAKQFRPLRLKPGQFAFRRRPARHFQWRNHPWPSSKREISSR